MDNLAYKEFQIYFAHDACARNITNVNIACSVDRVNSRAQEDSSSPSVAAICGDGARSFTKYGVWHEINRLN